jgi:hypothetical protein
MGQVKVIVHQFQMSDVDDPEIYAAQPIWEWQQTDAGKWVMENSKDTFWARHTDVHSFSYRYKIVATLTESDATYFALKYDNAGNT